MTDARSSVETDVRKQDLVAAGGGGKELGEHISLARRKRRFTQKMLAERALVSLATLQRLEKGDSSVSLAAVMRVLFLLDGLKSFDDILSPEKDDYGREELEARLPKRIRSSGDGMTGF